MAAEGDEFAISELARIRANEPEANHAFGWIWRAWHELTHDRPYRGGGMGPSTPGYIPWMVIRTWCRDYRLTEGEAHLLKLCFRAMDEVFVQWWTAKTKEATADKEI